MKNLLFILLCLVVPATSLLAQHRPHRTAEDIAMKQTEMLIRELNIQDSIVRDTLFRMHLKFARKREISNTRAEALQYMQEANSELQQILTPEQYQQFMAQQVNHLPHHPQPHHSRFNALSTDTILVPLSPEAPYMQPPPPEHQQTNHL